MLQEIQALLLDSEATTKVEQSLEVDGINDEIERVRLMGLAEGVESWGQDGMYGPCTVPSM